MAKQPTGTRAIPWKDEAVVIRQSTHDRADRKQVFAGELWQCVEWIDWLAPEGATFSIFLPDRRVAPLSFVGQEAHRLVGHLDRPRSTIGFIRLTKRSRR